MAPAATPVQSAPFGSEQILAYNPGGNSIWGELGYAVANFGMNPVSLNSTIIQFVEVSGRNLFAIMQNADRDLRIPPSINTIMRVCKLIVRARVILSARAKTPATPQMEATKGVPGALPFNLFPCPYWKCRNNFMREWAGLILQALSESMQHTENRRQFDVSTDFAGLVGQYLQRVYYRIGTELFGIDPAKASAADFTITPDIMATYNPAQWFTSTELIDTIPSFTKIPTAVDMQVLSDGIAANQITGLSVYAGNVDPTGGQANALYVGQQPQQQAAAAAGVQTSTGSFAPAPTP